MPVDPDLEPLARLDRIIEEEQSALMSGDIGSIEALEPLKIEAAEAISTLPRSSPTVVEALARLKTKVERNASLFAASARGLRSVIDRIEETRRISDRLETYGHDGQRRQHQTHQTNVERRA